MIRRSLAAASLCAMSLAACGEKSPQADIRINSLMTAEAATSPQAAPVPDEEASSIPTFGGVPVVPISAKLTNLAPALASSIVERRLPPEELDTNATAIEIIKECETLQLEAYELGGYIFVGYGHLVLEGEPTKITETEADAYLASDLKWCEGALERMLETDLSHNQFSAISAFCYNIGSAKIRNSSVVKLTNEQDWDGAANAFLLWNRMNGKVMKALADRRARERTLYLTP